MCDMNSFETSSASLSRFEPHVHEITGSTQIAERCEDPHNHRFATVSGEAIPYMGSHVHEIKFHTDTYDGHEHEFRGTTSRAIPVGDGRHVHFAKAVTTLEDGHSHEFRVASLIDNPIEQDCCRCEE